MIVKRNFSVARIIPYVRRELVFVALIATGVSVVAIEGGSHVVVLPFGPLGVLGTALAIFLGFRNNTGYARWWEARTLWAQIANSSRVLVRLIVSATGAAPTSAEYRREIVLRQIAFAHALRLRLRRQSPAELRTCLAPLISPAELERIVAAVNPPNLLLQVQSDRLKDGVREGKLGQFDPITLEPNLGALNAAHGQCEKLKDTPLLRQYDFFTRVFLWGFLLLLPSSLVGVFPADGARWATIPLSLAIGFIYAITHRIGQVTEDPFEHKIQDVPMTALCTSLERDLREQLGDPELPPPAVPVDGYLY